MSVCLLQPTVRAAESPLSPSLLILLRSVETGDGGEFDKHTEGPNLSSRGLEQKWGGN